MYLPNRVVITGLGVIAPGGHGKDTFWRTLTCGRSMIGPITLFDTTDSPCRIAGEISDWDASEFIERSLRPDRMTRINQFAIAAAQMAMQDARMDMEALKSEAQVILGVATCDGGTVDEHVEVTTEKGLDRGRPLTCSLYLPHASGLEMKRCFGIGDSLRTISNTCTSGLDALCEAAERIRSGRTDLALAGGAEASIAKVYFSAYHGAGVVSTQNDHPHKASRPFDAKRDSGVISEGAGFLVLESLEHALSRNASIYAEIAGFASASDPEDDELGGFRTTMRSAMANAGMTPANIDYICAHGPGHPDQDILETLMIKEVFGAQAMKLPVSSIKGAIGNTLASSGPHQVISACLAMQHGAIPPTTNFEFPDPHCDLDYVPRYPRKSSIQSVLVNVHGQGGGNTSMVIKRHRT